MKIILKRLQQLTVFTLAAFLLCCDQARAQNGPYTDFGTIPMLAQPPGDQMTANEKLDFHNDLFTGRFNYRIPIEVPPGRGGSGPDIALEYNSANANGWCGVGWDLDMGYIQRETRYGVPEVGGTYSDTYGNGAGFDSFTYSFEGQSGRLIFASDGTYRPEVDTSGLIFRYSGGYWTVTDRDGRTYFFGDSGYSQIDTTYGRFKWALSKIIDANGNQTTITYQSVNGQLYLQQISYNSNINSPAIAANCTVTFTLEPRSDIPNSCLSGTEIDTTELLEAITVTCNGGLVRQYLLSYAPSQSTGRSLLQSVREDGVSGSWPPITFSYSVQAHSFQPGVTWGPIKPQNMLNDTTGDSLSTVNTALIDMNGDGLPDWVVQPFNPTPFTNLIVQLNTGSGFGKTNNWGMLNNESNDVFNSGWNTINGCNTTTWLLSSLADVDGDLLPDRVMRQYSMIGSGYDHIQIQTNNGTGFGHESPITGVSSQANTYYTAEQLTYPSLDGATSDGYGSASLDLLIDMNGDGVADRVMAGDSGQFVVQLNNRNGSFASPVTWGNVAADGIGNYAYTPRYRDGNHVYSELMDMNGDGLPDRVMQSGNGGVQLNTGVSGSLSFTSPISWNYTGDPEIADDSS